MVGALDFVGRVLVCGAGESEVDGRDFDFALHEVFEGVPPHDVIDGLLDGRPEGPEETVGLVDALVADAGVPVAEGLPEHPSSEWF